MPFTALGLSPNILKAIKETGYNEPTPIQSKAVAPILAGSDVIGIAQTGTGKTAAFVWPMIDRLSARGSSIGGRGTRALILAPTRELAVQIDENIRTYAKHLKLRFATVYGGVGEGPQISALRSGVDIIIATPGRLLDLTRSGHVDYKRLEFVVLDEADRMLDMGFLPDIKRIMSSLPTERQTLLFSATLSPEIEKLSKDFLRNPVMVQIGRRATPAESVTQFMFEVPKHLKTNLLTHLLSDKSMDTVLVFSRTKHGADKIARKLLAANIPTATLHSNRSQSQRLLALKGFKSGQYRVLVATDIAARGIDVDGISHVVNFDFPPQPEDYVHRIGRTGRAKAIGDALSFVSSDEMPSVRALEKFIGRGLPRKVAEGFDYSAKPSADYAPDRDLNRGPRGARPQSSRGRSESSAFSPSRGPRSTAPRSREFGPPRTDRAPATSDRPSFSPQSTPGGNRPSGGGRPGSIARPSFGSRPAAPGARRGTGRNRP